MIGAGVTDMIAEAIVVNWKLQDTKSKIIHPTYHE
jgi:hypothetical protein